MVKNVGDSVEKGEAILELETDKVNVEVVSEEAGVLSEQLASEGDTVEVGQAIAVIGEGSGNASNESEKDKDKTPQQKDETENNKEEKVTGDDSTESKTSDDNQQRVNATPSARRYARENGVNLAEVSPKTNDVLRKEDIDKSKMHLHQHRHHKNTC